MNQPLEITSWTGDLGALAAVLRVSETELKAIAERNTKGRLIIRAAPANHGALMSAVRRQLAADSAEWP